MLSYSYVAPIACGIADLRIIRVQVLGAELISRGKTPPPLTPPATGRELARMSNPTNG